MTYLRMTTFTLPEKLYPDFNEELGIFLRDRQIKAENIVSVCRISAITYEIFYRHSDGQK